ncbi:MAG: cell envelope integrity protein TolA [Gammaproteobacteria bacterium]|nr:cell envelope integrity protein TolA [Gammaproteobacteria bacterium]
MNERKNPFETESETPARRKWVPIAGAAALVAIFSGAVVGIINMMDGTSAPVQPLVQEITILTPPPPPPPPEVEPPPPPEVEEVEIPQPDPEPIAADDAAEPPPGDSSGDDVVAGSGNGPSPFGSGGRGNRGPWNREGWYASQINRDIETALARNQTLRGKKFIVTVRMWISETGAISESEIVKGTGDASLDQSLAQILASDVRVREVPPDDMQPVLLRITSRS